MITDKIYITDRQAFIEWKRNYTNAYGKFYAECCNENEPNSYPCVLLEMEDYRNRCGEYNIFYDFIYLTDFISDYSNN